VTFERRCERVVNVCANGGAQFPGYPPKVAGMLLEVLECRTVHIAVCRFDDSAILLKPVIAIVSCWPLSGIQRPASIDHRWRIRRSRQDRCTG
jgi:hypothetical protein